MLDRLFPDERPIVGIVLQLDDRREEGWHLTIMVRRQGQSFLRCRQEDYDGLTRAELLDVVDVVVGDNLGVL